MRLYIDGAKEDTWPVSGVLIASTDPLWIGTRGTAERFAGRIDEVRVYPSALTQAEIVADMSLPVDATTPLLVALHTPAAAAEGVITTPITATFSRAMDPSTITAATFGVEVTGGGTATASVAYDAATRTATLTPALPLQPLTNYSATVAGGPDGVRDVNGNAMAESTAWTFRTGTGTSQLRLAYSFTEGAGTTTLDKSGNGNTGTLISNPVWGEGKYGPGLIFDGVDDAVVAFDANSLDVTTAFTMEAWVYPTTSIARGSILYKHTVTDPPYQLALTNTGQPRVQVTTAEGTGTLKGPDVVPSNTWTHLAVTSDGATLRLYVNGLEAVATPAALTLITSTRPLVLGTRAGAEWFTGRLDEVRLYGRALSQAEIAADMDTPVDDVSAPTVTLVSPAADATEVDVSTSITATFSEPLLPPTVGSATFELRDAADALVTAAVTYDDTTRSVTLDPVGTLAEGTTYTATLKGGPVDPRVKDAAGNALAADFAWSFTTTGAPAATVTALAVSPTGVSVATGATHAFVANATYADGTTRDVTTEATWTSSDAAVATVLTGSATAVGPGLAAIQASFGGQTAEGHIQVANGTPLPPDPAWVAPPLDRSLPTILGDATAFLYTGQNPIQQGVAPGTIARYRAAVVRGRVTTTSDTPLPGVVVSIKDHPELGLTQTRADGWFDLAINGGGYLTVQYAKDGYLPAVRQIETPWEAFVTTPDVALVTLDSAVTTVASGSAITQVARGSASTDTSGTRQATLLFAAGTAASLVKPDGTTEPASTLHVRATEYTVGPRGPKAMPAALPPSSAYTYAVELSADEAMAAGATSVTFSHPVAWYTENFLHFPVGGAVPVGYYDPQKNAWVPSDNGRIIGILSESGGRAALDLDGAGAPATPAQVAELGINDAELERLAELYEPGQSLWRVAITHFSAWDANWPYSPPQDATESDATEADGEDEKTGEEEDCQGGGSTIGCQSGTLNEVIPVVGTPFSLHYKSSRVPGRRTGYTLDIPASGATVPGSLKGIEVVVNVAGQTIRQSLAPAGNQRVPFRWNGRDAYGRQFQGSSPAVVSIGYVYDAQYATPAPGSRSFGQAGAGPMTGDDLRQEITLWRSYKRHMGNWDITASGAGGWTLNVSHSYDPGTQTLYLGDGTERSAAKVEWRVMDTVAGGGTVVGSAGDGLPARQSSIVPIGMRAAPDGSLFFSDNKQNIRKVDPSGVMQTVAAGVTGIVSAIGPDGSVYVSSSNEGVVKRIRPGGQVEVVAGSGTQGFAGDGGPATAAQLDHPQAVSVAPDGTLYISDLWNARIRRVTPDGLISTFAGNGTWGFGGDGGPATAAALQEPFNTAVAPDGSVYIVDSDNGVVRRVTPDGIIRTVIGSGLWGFSGDGGPAAAASLDFPVDVTVGSDGAVYVTEWINSRVRRVSTDGLISTVAGSGSGTFSGDGGPATGAVTGNLQFSAVTPDGTLFVADHQNGRIRRVKPVLPKLTGTDTVIPSADGVEAYVLDSRGRHLRTVDARTGIDLYRFEYNSDGALIRITDGDGNITSIERTGRVPSAIVAPGGQRTVLTTDARGYLTTVQDPGGNTTRMDYDDNGLLVAFTTPNGHQSTMVYDEKGHLSRDANPANGFWNLSVAELGRRTTTTMETAEGRLFAYTFERRRDGITERTATDAAGLLTGTLVNPNGTRTLTTPDGSVVTSVVAGDPRWGLDVPMTKALTMRLPSGLTSSVSAERALDLGTPGDPFSLLWQEEYIDVNGRFFYLSWDTALRTTWSYTPENRETIAIHDGQGRVTWLKGPGVWPVSFTYDPKGRLTEITQGDRTATIGYDAQNRPTTLTDALLRQVHFTYDPAGRVLTQTLPDLREIAFGYDSNGNVTSLTPPSRPAHGFTYTPIDLTSTYAPPPVPGATGYTQFGYNRDRALTSITRPDGTAVNLSYDTGGRLHTVTHPTASVTYSYASTGQVSTITTAAGVGLAFTFDGPLPVREQWTGPVAGTLDRTFDENFFLTAETLNGSAVEYRYDRDGLVTQAGRVSVDRSPASGLPTRVSLWGVQSEWTIDDYGEATHENHTDLQASRLLFEVTYTRDKLGRITSRGEVVDEVTRLFEYQYDAAGRLAAWLRNGSVVASYGYDANGNRTSVTTDAGTVTATYDAQDQILTLGNTTYTHAPTGERLTKTVDGQTTTYAYDAFGNLVRVDLPDGRIIRYLVDGRNRRIGKLVNDVLVQGWLYGDQLRPIAELDGQGNVVARFVYGSRTNIPDYFTKDGVDYRVIADHLGSPRVVINTQTREIVQRMDFDPWGAVTRDSNPGLQPFGYAGGLYDPDTELVRFGARDYDAGSGRWLAKDPIFFRGGVANLYGYVSNDPVTLIDVSGEQVLMRSHELDTWRAVQDFLRNYERIKEVNTINADKYFHCMANCEASRRGVAGVLTAKVISETRELVDEYVKGDSAAQCNADRAANRQGREAPAQVPCPQACASLKPPSLRE